MAKFLPTRKDANGAFYICKDCKQEFYISNSNQQYFLEKKLKLPKRCKPCRRKNAERVMLKDILTEE